MALTKISRAILDTGISDSSDATAITIDSSERVGIGTSSPSKKLHVEISGDASLFDRTGSTGGVMQFANGGTVKGNVGVQSGGFGLGGGFRDPDLFITTGGAVGIGTTSPGDPLVVSDSGASSITARLINTNADANPANLRLQKLSSSPADGDYVGMINVSGENDASEETIFQSIDFISTDVSDGTEDGVIAFRTRGAGTLAERVRITESGFLKFPSKVAFTGQGDAGLGHHTNDYLYMYGGSAGLILQDNSGGSNRILLRDSNSIEFEVNGSQRAQIDSAGTLKFNSGFGSVGDAYGVRAWVNFDGTASSISPRGAANVGSITDHGVGQYTCNFTNAMPDTNYVIFGSGGHTTESNQISVSQNRGATAPATGSCRISVTYANSYLIDVGQVTVAFIR